MRSTVDAERLNHLLAWAEAEDLKAQAGLPSAWDQTVWSNSCGTACCIAGKVALEDGGKPVAREYGQMKLVNEFRMPNGQEVEPEAYARRELGLTDDEAEALFESNNDLDRLRGLVAAIVAGTFEAEDWER